MSLFTSDTVIFMQFQLRVGLLILFQVVQPQPVVAAVLPTSAEPTAMATYPVLQNVYEILK